MSIQPHGNPDGETYATVGVDASEFDRYAVATGEDGTTTIYDTRGDDAWIRAEFSIGRDMML